MQMASVRKAMAPFGRRHSRTSRLLWALNSHTYLRPRTAAPTLTDQA